MIKAILLDIDGTLTNDRKEITPKTREALLAAQEQGVRLMLASGRPAGGLRRYAEELDMYRNHGVFICYNGAQVMDCATGETYFSRPMGAADVRAVLDHMKGFDVWPVLYHGDYVYTTDVFGCALGRDYVPDPYYNIIEYEARSNNYLLCEKGDLAAFADFETSKILVAGEPTYLQAHHEQMAAPFSGKLSSMFTAPFFFEFTARGIDKANAIMCAFERLGIGLRDAMAFGDAQNDTSMLELVGCGVAMGNAVEQTKAVANEVTLSNNEDGIALSLSRHIPGLERFGA